MEKLMFALVALFFLLSSPDADASTMPVDKHCYMLVESPQNHRLCFQTYNYDSIDVYFKDFHGKEVKAVVRRQFRKTAPTVLINAQYSFEAVCAEGVRCDTSILAQDSLMAFRQAVVNKAFYTYIDKATACAAGALCPKSSSSDLTTASNAAAADKNTQAIQNAQIVALAAESAIHTASTVMEMKNATSGVANQPIVYTAMFGTNGALLGYCKVDGHLVCQNQLTVIADSQQKHESTLVTSDDIQGDRMEIALRDWLRLNRSQLTCQVRQTSSTVANGSKVLSTFRTCAVQ